MIEVRIREEYDTSAVKLGEVAFDEAALDRVIPLLCEWGVADRDGNTHAKGEMVGQFALRDGDAYFEVILISDD